jgi:flagellar motor protein MotB
MLAFPGVSASAEGESLRVLFDEGVFAAGGDVPTESGVRALRAVAASLARGADDLSEQGRELVVDIVGSSDDRPTRPGGSWSDNWTLGLARATAAAGVLRAQAAGARILWRVSSVGPEGAPWPQDTEARRARNRTVILLVWIPAEPVPPALIQDQP